MQIIYHTSNFIIKIKEKFDISNVILSVDEIFFDDGKLGLVFFIANQKFSNVVHLEIIPNKRDKKIITGLIVEVTSAEDFKRKRTSG